MSDALVLQWEGPTGDLGPVAAIIGPRGATGDVTPELMQALADAEAAAADAESSAAQLRLIRKTSNYTAVSGDQLLCDTSGGAFSLTLPAAPAAAAFVRVVGSAWATNNLTVLRNGQTIEGVADNVLLDFDDDLMFVFAGGTWKY